MTDGELESWWRSYRGAYDTRSWLDYRPLLAESLKHATEPPLLDVGCGYGFLVECARRFGIVATGIEMSAHALSESRARHPQADVRPWTAGTTLPFEPESFGIAGTEPGRRPLHDRREPAALVRSSSRPAAQRSPARLFTVPPQFVRGRHGPRDVLLAVGVSQLRGRLRIPDRVPALSSPANLRTIAARTNGRQGHHAGVQAGEVGRDDRPRLPSKLHRVTPELHCTLSATIGSVRVAVLAGR